MFEFLGLLFSCCIRTAVKIPLDASFVWKAIAHGSLGNRDLLSIDKNFYELLEGLRSMNKRSSMARSAATTTRSALSTLGEFQTSNMARNT